MTKIKQNANNGTTDDTEKDVPINTQRSDDKNIKNLGKINDKELLYNVITKEFL
jgi:hypothetical protein